jgi:ABC-type polysaccharide/polyol phosphate export permease
MHIAWNCRPPMDSIDASRLGGAGQSPIPHLRELWSALVHWRIWWVTALDDTVGRYRRTMLGPLWITLGHAGLIAGLYFLRARFSGNAPNYLIYVSAGMSCWAMLAAFIADGSNSLVRAKGLIESYPVPVPIHSLRAVAAALINTVHLLVVYLVLLAVMRFSPGLEVLAFIPAVLLALVFGVGAALLFGPLGARFRDLTPAIGMLTSALFILTPVFWVPTAGQSETPLIRFNPFYYLLEVLRGPLVGVMPSAHIWTVASCVALATLVLGVLTYIRMRPQVVYWL